MPYKSVPQEFPTRVSNKSVPQESPVRVTHKSVLQECLTRVSHKSVLQECPTRVSHKSVLQECHLDICSFSIVFAFGVVGSILFMVFHPTRKGVQSTHWKPPWNGVVLSVFFTKEKRAILERLPPQRVFPFFFSKKFFQTPTPSMTTFWHHRTKTKGYS